MSVRNNGDFRERIRQSFTRQAAMETIGAELTRVEHGMVEIELPFDVKLTQQHGILHAGIISAALDSACGFAAYSVIDADASILTIEFKVNLMSPGRGERFLFRGEITKPGSNIIVADGRGYAIGDGPAKLIASMTGTMMVVRGRGNYGMKFELKPIAGKSILFVMAAEAEYGPFLRSRFEPLMTGVGPVEAAVAMTKTLSRLDHADDLPQLVVSLGSAGSATLEQTEVYQVSSVSYRDMDASALGFEKGHTPFLDLPAAIDLPLRIPGIPEASLSTGGNVISGAAYRNIAADMVDMETFAILRACQGYKLPLIGLRGISDGAEELQHISGWTEYLHVIDRKLSYAVDSLFTALEDGVFWF